MDWRELKAFASWQPVRDLPGIVREVEDGLFQLEDTAFVFAVPYEMDLASSTRGPLVTLAVWAESIGAARRALNGKVDADEMIPGSRPPDEMLLSPGHSTYAMILTDARAVGSRSGILEMASYGTNGAFIHAKIMARGFEFMFRDNRVPVDLQPYAICFSASRAARNS